MGTGLRVGSGGDRAQLPPPVQLKAGHSQGSITERYIHAAQVLFPGAAAKGEERLFGDPDLPEIGVS
jgi:hypothetical protein